MSLSPLTVICAAPPGPNPGMSSVDLAFFGVVRRHLPGIQPRFVHLYTPVEIHRGKPPQELARLLRRQQLPFDYECFRGKLDDVYASKAVVFWGDFLHGWNYQKHIAPMLVHMGLAKDLAEAFDTVYRHLDFSHAPDDVLARSLVFGETLIFNRARDYAANPVYAGHLKRFMSGLSGVWMRDVYSALQVTRMRQRFDEANLGVDCSLLLHREDLAGLPITRWSSEDHAATGRVGVFLGRTAYSPKMMARFAREVCDKINLPAQWIPWGDASAFDDRVRQAQRGFPKLEFRQFDEVPTLGDLYSLLGRYQLVISDTYHVCLNAWRLGVPAICIGQTVSQAAWSISSGNAYAWRDKRQAFYAMQDAMEFYVYAEELEESTWRQRRVYQLSELLKDRAVQDAVIQRVMTQRDAAESMLVSRLRQLLGITGR